MLPLAQLLGLCSVLSSATHSVLSVSFSQELALVRAGWRFSALIQQAAVLDPTWTILSLLPPELSRCRSVVQRQHWCARARWPSPN